MTSPTLVGMSWAERVADRSPTVQRSRSRTVRQAKVIIDAARRLVGTKGSDFTTQELVKEAGIALQTFYRYFASKDELLLAVFEDMVSEGCRGFAQGAQELSDPIARIKFYITSALTSLTAGESEAASSRFLVITHWRLQRRFPDEIASAMQPFADLLLTEINAARKSGLLHTASPERDAWFINQLVQSVFHYYACASESPTDVGEELWHFCVRALGGTPG